jgi:RHS repeat-associated protein
MNDASRGDQIISLPQGGGAIRGIGEKFSPDLHTGTGNFSVPLSLPSGRGAFQPRLALEYSTGNGNGPFGLGWRVSVPGINRKTSHGIPVYDDHKDVFLLPGAEDLVAVEQLGTATRYRPRTEGLFASILYHRDSANAYWEVRTTDGHVTVYGTEASLGSDSAAIADPDDRTHVFAWRLTRTEDVFGNRIQYDYVRDMGQDGPHRWDQLYLSRIRYVDHGANRTHPQYLVSVEFAYEDRPDPFSDHRAGFEIRTRRRCTRVSVRTVAGSDQLVRTYSLTYLDQRPELSNAVPVNGVSLLSMVRVAGHDGQATEELPPLEFHYTSFEPQRRRFSAVEGTDLPLYSLAHPDLAFVDLFARGLPDILEMNGTVRFWRNVGGGRFDVARTMPQAPGGLALGDPGVQLLDADGDGRTDLLVSQGSLAGYFPLNTDGTWDAESFRRYRYAPSFSVDDPKVRLVDLDGDGITDAIRSGARLECFFNDLVAGWNETRVVERRAPELFPNVDFSDPRVRCADFTGDGLQDIALVSDSNVEYWPSRGHGRWGERVRMARSPRLPYRYDPRRILIGDVDGDGLADLVYVDDTTVTLWINQSGNGWSEPLTVEGTPPVSDTDGLRLLDLLGSGIAGVLWTKGAGGMSRQRLFFLDFTGNRKPYLLTEMDNHLGAVTRVEYAPSTRFYLEDQRRKQHHWKTTVPFPVQVVWRRETIDYFSNARLTSEYRYHHGYWDGVEREFRGFGMVEQFDTESFSSGAPITEFHSPPTLTKTWFHQGAVADGSDDWTNLDWSEEYWEEDPPLLHQREQVARYLRTIPLAPDSRRIKRDALRALRGCVLRTELFALDGSPREHRPYTVTESSYGIIEIEPPGNQDDPRRRIFFPHVTAQRTTQWERGRDPMTSFSFTRYRRKETDPFDRFGRPLSSTNISCPRGWHGMDHRPASGYLATHVVNVFAAPVSSSIYIHTRVASTTTFEATNTAGKTVLELAVVSEESAFVALVGHERHFYDGPAFIGLPSGQIGGHGVLTRSEALALTDDVLEQAYGTSLPPYLDPTGVPAWSGEYPPDFRSLTAQRVGYTFHAGGSSPLDPRGYFITTVRRRYDVHTDPDARGLVVEALDPLHDNAIDPSSHRTITAYDAFDLLPVAVTDAAGLTMTVSHDYRVFGPAQVTDANGNATRFTYSPLGLITSTWLRGKSSSEGDQHRPTLLFEYGLLAFEHSAPAKRQPAFVRKTRRLYHDADTAVPLASRNETIVSFEYSDGFGRVLQTRTQSDDERFGGAFGGGDTLLPSSQSSAASGDIVGRSSASTSEPNVVVSGWQVYDNKGRVVQRFEPFFSTGWDYAHPTDAQHGVTATLFYDPRGRLIRSVNPDGSENLVIQGVPGTIAAVDLERPDVFEPTPWETYAYDVNDNAGRTHAATSASYRHHWNTPASNYLDALGRIVESVERSRVAAPTPAAPLPPIQEVRTRTTFDIRGNVVAVIDALGRPALQNTVDHANRILRVDSIDAGSEQIVLNAAGAIVELRATNGALTLHGYDGLNRLIRVWARDGGGQPMTMRGRNEYGDGGTSGQPAAERAAARLANRLGRLSRTFDEAGVLSLGAYDFKGNALEKTRRVVSDTAILSVFNGPPAGWDLRPFRVDWTNPPAIAVDAQAYTSTAEYDAWNRARRVTHPEAVDGTRRVSVPIYGRSGVLRSVTMDGTPVVERIAYNARGQRVLVAYGNRLMTRYAYDPQTFRLTRIRTEGFSVPAGLTYRPSGAVLQDVAYAYDLAGNILAIHDRTPNCGINGTVSGRHALDRTFTYDATYRLRSATGRECERPPDRPWDDAPRCVDLTRVRAWTEQYTFDPLGSLTELRHQTGNGSFVDLFDIQPGTNRLKQLRRGLDTFGYEYDGSGNLTREAASRHLEWDHCDRLRVFRTQTPGSEPTVHAQYLYDSGGRRVKKVVRKPGNRAEVTIYVDSFEHQRVIVGNTVGENNTLHISDGGNRVARIRVGPAFDGDSTPATTYHVIDHLGSSAVVADATGALVNREEYTPYGLTSFGSFARKRYRFGGHERDTESGLYYAGARYYLPWTARWASCDPAGTVDGLNLYAYVRNNPLRLSDPTGTQGSAGDIPTTSNTANNEPPMATDSGGGHAHTRPEPEKENEEPFGPPPPPAPPPPPVAGGSQPSRVAASLTDALKSEEETIVGNEYRKRPIDKTLEQIQEGVLFILGTPVRMIDEASGGAISQTRRGLEKALDLSESDKAALDVFLATEGGAMMESAGNAGLGLAARRGAPRISNPQAYLPARASVLQHAIAEDLNLHPIAENRMPVGVTQPNLPSRVHIVDVGTKAGYEALTSGRIRLEPWEIPGEPPQFARIDGALKLSPHVEEAGATTPGYAHFGGFTGTTPVGCPSCSVRFHYQVYPGWFHVNPTPGINYAATPLHFFYP